MRGEVTGRIGTYLNMAVASETLWLNKVYTRLIPSERDTK